MHSTHFSIPVMSAYTFKMPILLNFGRRRSISVSGMASLMSDLTAVSFNHWIPDQDALNIAAYYYDGDVSFIEKDGMDFKQGKGDRG